MWAVMRMKKKRHDKAMEQLAAAQAKWNKERTQRLDFINERLRKEHIAVQDFDDTDQAMKLYYYATHKNLQLPPKPKLSNFITHQKIKRKERLHLLLVVWH